MKKLIITKADLNGKNEYIGKEDVSDYDGSIEIAGELGCVVFASLKAKGRIEAKSGSGISAGDGISAGSGISAGWGISAGSGISAGWGISAGDGISAGCGISAGDGISAGLSITCKKVLKVGFRIFAGTSKWRKEVTDEEKTITCKKLESGKVEYGLLFGTG